MPKSQSEKEEALIKLLEKSESLRKEQEHLSFVYNFGKKHSKQEKKDEQA